MLRDAEQRHTHSHDKLLLLVGTRRDHLVTVAVGMVTAALTALRVGLGPVERIAEVALAHADDEQHQRAEQHARTCSNKKWREIRSYTYMYMYDGNMCKCTSILEFDQSLVEVHKTSVSNYNFYHYDMRR